MNYEAVLGSLPDAVIAVAATLRVVFWNAAAEVLTARSTRRAQGRLVKEVFAPTISVVSRLAETLATGESRSEADGAIETTDGRVVPVSVLTAPLFAQDGTVEGALAVLRGSASSRTRFAAGRRSPPRGGWPSALPTRSATRSARFAARSSCWRASSAGSHGSPSTRTCS